MPWATAFILFDMFPPAQCCQVESLLQESIRPRFCQGLPAPYHEEQALELHRRRLH